MAGCAERVPIVPGGRCELTIECAAPLVCRLGSCREECREVRDCRAGLLCVRDSEGYGVCQVLDESECTLSSDCPEGLVCRFDTCTNVCSSDRDCINGLICDVIEAGNLACRDPSEEECRLNSDCRDPLICARDLRCRPECRTNRDCRDGLVCDVTAADPSCVPESMLTDAGMDSGVDAMDAMPDTGVVVLPPPLPDYQASQDNGCRFDGTDLRCWGSNGFGQVGVTASTSGELPTMVTGIGGGTISTFDVGVSHVCAVTSAVYCWGNNDEGQLGHPATLPSRHTPAAIATPLPSVVGVALGVSHSCAWTSDSVRCWGDNVNGQLGDGTTMDSDTPTVVGLVGRPVQVAAGYAHTCALRDDGLSFCWGRNDLGAVGDGTRDETVTTPRQVMGVSRVAELAAGRGHTCARHLDGTVTCWGENDREQAGAAPAAPGVDPTPVPLGGTAQQISVALDHSCALLTDGTVTCWGSNANFKIGRALGPGSAVPEVVGFSTSAVAVGTGSSYTCILTPTGQGECVGRNTTTFYEFGAPTNHTSETPLMVTW
jgi:alpha-tubulin suppressor-like RCC1 family protein